MMEESKLFCLETYLQESDNYEILISRAGFKDCAKIIEENSPNIIYVNAGDKVLGVRIIGIPPVPVGINEKKGTIIFPYTKPCYGTAVIEIPIENTEIEKVKEMNIKGC